MKLKNLILIMTLLVFWSCLFCVKTTEPDTIITLILNPGPDIGKDAILRYYMGPDPNNYGDHPLVNIHAWTNSGIEVIHRSLLEFNLGEISSSAEIIEALLYLYAIDPNLEISSAWAEGCHHHDNGSNACIVRRVCSDWDEETVNWETQPLVTQVNEVTILEDSVYCQDYIIEVTQLVIDQIQNSNTSIGLLIQLINETYYRRMTFASSDFADPSKWPKLVIKYK